MLAGGLDRPSYRDKTGKRAEAPLDRALAVGKRFMTLIEQVTD
jgi:hypothetical protein